MAKTKSLLYGFAIGTIITGATALLSAPKSGKDVRQDIKIRAARLKGSFSAMKQNSIILKEKVMFVSKEGKEAFKQASADMKKDIGNWKEDVQPNMEHIQEGVKEIQGTIEETKSTVAK